MKIFITLFIVLYGYNLFGLTPPSPVKPPTQKERYKCMIESFDSIIDMYISSTYEQKCEFLNSLDDEEIEVFFKYLRDKYPKEYKKLP